MRRICTVLLAGAALIAAAPAWAQAWPSKPVRVIVPFAPGGATDNGTRPFTEKLTNLLGQQFVIDNKGGAAGAVGFEAGVRSPPDGYTFFMASTAIVTVLPNVRKTPYDPFTDVALVGRYVDSVLTFAVHPSVPATTVAEFIAYAKANPGKVHFGSSGLGTMTQMCGELLKKQGGIDIVHVPYRGGAESLADLLAGHVQAYFEASVLPHAKAGKARLLAIIDTERHPDFPDVPTMAEVLPGYNATTWFGLFAPAGTPQPILAKMAQALNEAAADAEMRERLLKLGLRPRTDTQEAFATALRQDYDRYGALARELNIRME